MPNMKNAKKAVKVNAKRTVENNNYEASMKTAIKKAVTNPLIFEAFWIALLNNPSLLVLIIICKMLLLKKKIF